MSLIFERIDAKSIHVGAPTLEVIAGMDVKDLSKLLHDMHESPFMADLSIGRDASVALLDREVAESTSTHRI